MKEIPLTQNRVALVDDDDYERIVAWNWIYAGGVRKNGTPYTGYAQTVRAGVTIKMHREILGATPGQRVDHKNQNPLDNRKENLRLANNSQNIANAKRYAGARHPYKGVAVCGAKWRAEIRVNGKHQHLGVFETITQAARAYDRAAVQHFGEFARPNFPSCLP